MKKLINWTVHNSKIVLFLTFIVACIGAYGYHFLPRQESPDVSAPVAMIITAYPGASANDMQDLVTKKIEEKLAQLDGYDESSSQSQEGISVVSVMFDANTETDKALQDVRNKVADVQQDLPSGCMASEVKTDLMDSSGILISLSGANYSYEQLASFADLFKDELVDVEGITKCEVEGKLNKEVKVDINTGKLNQLGLSIEDVCSILQTQNIQIPTGSIDYGDNEITLSTPGNFTSIDDVKNTILLVSPDSGIVTKLGDIADIRFGLEDGSEKYKQNGNNAVLLAGYFQKNKNVVIIGKDARNVIDDVKATLPSDLRVEEVVYQPGEVSASTNEFMMHLILGIVLVMLVVFWGMGFRNALVVSTAIPLSILMTFIVMYLFNVPIHMISLTALIISLGILVDNAIVVCDTIHARIEAGDDRMTGAYQGAIRCIIPIFTATICIMASMSPLAAMPGIVGKFFNSIPIVLISAVLASYIVAMFVTPAMMVLFHSGEKHIDKTQKIRKFFLGLLDWGLRKKKICLLSVFAALVVVMVTVMPFLSSEFFPFADKNIFYMDITCEKAGSVDSTEKLTDEISSLLEKQPEITGITTGIGNGLPKFYVTMFPPFPAEDYAQMACHFDLKNVDNKRFKNNREFAVYLQSLLDENISGGKCKIKLLALAKPRDASIVVRVSGKSIDQDIRQISAVADKVKTAVTKVPGTTNVRKDIKDDTYQLSVELDENKLSSLGMTKYDVQRQISIALYGYDASVYRKDGKEYNIRVKSDIKNTELLDNLMIKSSITGKKVPLHEFATISYSEKVELVKTYKNKKSVAVLVDLMPGYDANKMENTIESEVLPTIDTTGTKISFEGDREDISKYFGAVGVGAIIAVFAIYIILFLQFKSFMQPLIILITIPLSLIGVLPGLLIFGQPLSMTAFLGIIALIGLVVKNGILLIDYINTAREAGNSVDEACRIGVDQRFNAIILSALTVILALIPLAVSGNELFSPMAVSLMAGLTVATFLTMVVVPVVYSVAAETIAGSGSNKYILAASKIIKDIAHSKLVESTTEGIKKAVGGVNKAGKALLEKLVKLISLVVNSIKNKKR